MFIIVILETFAKFGGQNLEFIEKYENNKYTENNR